ncbi:MAG: hypothetical protein NZZ41_00225 [Candidatus Dojkabacteria bacterium]|nr:hypothetical protein [Candidatus Dojkabacteria bacterium]
MQKEIKFFHDEKENINAVSKGVVTFVLSDEKNNKFNLYLKCALLQSLSFYFFNKQKISIIIYEQDEKLIPKKYQNYFDKIIKIKKEEFDSFFSNNITYNNYKNFYFEYIVNRFTPYDYTIKTDSDIVWTKKLDDYYWNNIHKFDLWFTANLCTFLDEKYDNKKIRRKLWEENDLPDIYSAVFGFNKKSKKVLEFFYLCEQIFINYEILKKIIYKSLCRHIPDTDYIMSTVVKLMKLNCFSYDSNWKMYHLTKEFIEEEFHYCYHIINSWRIEIKKNNIYYGLNKLSHPFHIQVKTEKNIDNFIKKFENIIK